MSTINVQVGVCNSLPVVVTIPGTGLLPINYKYVKMLHTFYKDAPADFIPYRFINRPAFGPYSRMWQQGLQPYMAGYQFSTDEAGWVYPQFDMIADRLVAMGVAQEVVSPYAGMPGWAGRPYQDWMVLG